MNTLSPLGRAALRYAAHGWPVYPQQPRGKRPLISKEEGGRAYLDATTDAKLITRWWTQYPTANIACAPGRAGLLVIDADGEAAIEAAARLGITPSVTLTSSRGVADRWHCYFRRPADIAQIGNLRLVPEVSTLELRCDRGGMTLPPSVHASGQVYRWNGRIERLGQLPPMALAALRGALDRYAAAESTRLAVPVDPRTLTTETIDKRVNAYVARLGQCEAGSRSNTAFRLAAFLVRDIALDIVQARAYLVSWNTGNVPPLPEVELLNVLKSALKHGRRPVGSGIERPRTLAARVRAADYRRIATLGDRTRGAA